ncbi:hypothetical protein LTR36_009346 [Oleoguttula mirabilis]|uniref:Uncharacterized protein n=1 Tax=Oleoguttula mirabilis TaxID=1507867 RepID=A0AAV9JS96_9PEZI|nr:hypothetical protein LTR36_009346 [Oleoguttula mirabilis]
MTFDERKESKEKLEQDGRVTLRPKKNKKKKKPITLEAKDIEFRAETRDVVPVKNSYHFTNWEKQGLWEQSVKYTSVRRTANTDVPLTAFSRCRMARRFRLEDRKKQSKGANDSGTGSETATSASSSVETLDEKLSEGYYDNASSEDSDDSLSPGLEDYSVEQLNEIYNDQFVGEFAVPKAAEAGDVVVIVAGSATPFVLRKVSQHDSSSSTSQQRFTYVGPAVLTDQLYNPKASIGYDVWCYHRLQRSHYAHFQVLLQLRVRANKAETFEVV